MKYGIEGSHPIQISVDIQEENNRVYIRFGDNGPGFPKKMDLDSVKPFHSTKDGDVKGLGIYICKMFVETLGGNISHEPKEAMGSEISFCIPARRKGEDDEM